MTHNLSFITCPALLAKLGWRRQWLEGAGAIGWLKGNAEAARTLSEATDSDYYGAVGWITSDLTAKGWSVEGCFTDSDNPRYRAMDKVGVVVVVRNGLLEALHAAYTATKGK
ncbi:MAG: hypothetical protein KDB18_10195 [Salinibacterium sp.]|nr:hypothetical protein [Salinibacterium sp.]